MRDRTAHIAREWLAKCVNVVVDARRGGDASASTSSAATSKPNRWFNASYAEARAVDDAVRSRECGDGIESGAHARARVFVIDVFMTRDDGGKELVERWGFHGGAEAHAVGGNNHFNKDLETSVVYKRAVIMVRTLIALMRTLPVHGVRWRAMRKMGRGADGVDAAGRFSFQIREEDESKASMATALADAHPGKDAGYRTYVFTDVPTSMGKLRACVYFLDALSMRALEERCVRVVDANANANDVALVGGDMSLSPSPTKKCGGALSPNAGRLIVEAAVAASALARGLHFDEDDGDDATEIKKSNTARPPHPSDAMTMRTSQSSDSIAAQKIIQNIPMASYTSPNHQRFDHAPSSAPNRGPAPIYGFNAAPVHSPSSRTGSADKAMKRSSASALPPRRPESCLKIDVGTSMDRGDFSSDATHRLEVFSSSSRREGVIPTSPLASAQPESPSTPQAGATPITCSPRVAPTPPRAFVDAGSVGKSSRTPTTRSSGSASPWGGFACPESPSPSLSSPSHIRGASMGSTHRSSWSPSSSLGTSLRDVVGVYPHSPGAIQRRLSGAASDTDDTEDIADGEFAPFTLDEDPSATYVEHTPADLLQLLDAPPTLRRSASDRALPLDAALDDDDTDENPRRASLAHAGKCQRVTLDWALEEIRRMDVVKDAMRDA